MIGRAAQSGTFNVVKVTSGFAPLTMFNNWPRIKFAAVHAAIMGSVFPVVYILSGSPGGDPAASYAIAGWVTAVMVW